MEWEGSGTAHHLVAGGQAPGFLLVGQKPELKLLMEEVEERSRDIGVSRRVPEKLGNLGDVVNRHWALGVGAAGALILLLQLQGRPHRPLETVGLGATPGYQAQLGCVAGGTNTGGATRGPRDQRSPNAGGRGARQRDGGFEKRRRHKDESTTPGRRTYSGEIGAQQIYPGAFWGGGRRGVRPRKQNRHDASPNLLFQLSYHARNPEQQITWDGCPSAPLCLRLQFAWLETLSATTLRASSAASILCAAPSLCLRIQFLTGCNAQTQRILCSATW